MELWAKGRLILFWFKAPKVPINMDSKGHIAMIKPHESMKSWRVSSGSLDNNAIVAIFGVIAKYAVTDVGAPSYTSGVHIWNGTALILKRRATGMNGKPIVTAIP